MDYSKKEIGKIDDKKLSNIAGGFFIPTQGYYLKPDNVDKLIKAGYEVSEPDAFDGSRVVSKKLSDGSYHRISRNELCDILYGDEKST